MIDIQTILRMQAQSLAPEAVSVKVLTPSEEIARTVAPWLAQELYPGRTFGQTLHLEWQSGADPGWICAVEVQ